LINQTKILQEAWKEYSYRSVKYNPQAGRTVCSSTISQFTSELSLPLCSLYYTIFKIISSLHKQEVKSS
jgi:hypothetical protein